MRSLELVRLVAAFILGHGAVNPAEHLTASSYEPTCIDLLHCLCMTLQQYIRIKQCTKQSCGQKKPEVCNFSRQTVWSP